jgi:peptidoglycan-associated lipoprotein
MKRVIFSSAVAVLLLLSGCAKSSQVPPATDGDPTAQEDEPTATDGTSEDGTEVSSDSQGQDIGDIPVVYFDFDSYVIKADQETTIADIAQVVTDAEQANFRIEGNCDEWGTEEYNYALGLRRAKSVQDALIRSGVDTSRLTLISYGESNPVCTTNEKNCWRQNRRVELTVLP